MERLTNTPFGARTVNYAEFQAAKQLAEVKLTPVEDKWAVLRDLTVSRRAFDVTDRDLAVLNALASFLPGVEMTPDNGLIVFPSNRALCERAHGMAESTLRRHIAALVRAGLIQRHDSPNGKRYAVRGQGVHPTVPSGLT